MDLSLQENNIESGGKSITTPYTLESGQSADETTAYFVLEHAPDSCSAYPADGVCTFTNISAAVDGKVVTPEWKAVQQLKKCDSVATIVNPETIKFTWKTVGEEKTVASTPSRFAPTPVKWGFGREGASLPSVGSPQT